MRAYLCESLLSLELLSEGGEVCRLEGPGGEGEEAGRLAAAIFIFLWWLVVNFRGPEELKGGRQGSLICSN